MCHQIIQHNKFCLNKYLLKENQVQEKSMVAEMLQNEFLCDIKMYLY